MNRRTAHSHSESPQRSLTYDDGVEPEDNGPYADVADPLTGAVRLCAEMCTTCIFRPGNLMDLQSGRVVGMVSQAQQAEGHVVCHKTLGSESPAICRGFADGPNQGRSLALRLARALGTLTEVTPP
ncbi:hypothetical protein QF035_002277 [Streptomyces umbrinus]|uniref:Ferredoxin n=1 Tax=Streptomyces umbrinus TaxID=67370 RepID=A0ABU0SMA4_9ACTN|nr:hypothetical protein [Streptomyces umbrinus]MDQ1024695.1 hypothetical protein [Streptomyces umbrinus]